MAGTHIVNALRLGDSATDTQNFQLRTNVNGTATLARGAAGNLGDVLTVDASGNVNAPTALQQGGVAMPRMVLATAQNTTSGTSIDFTGIPSWVKRITVMLNSISTNGSSLFLIQIGAGSVEVTGYVSGASSRSAETTSTAGFVLNTAGVAAMGFTGQNVITLIGSNLYVSSGILPRAGTGGDGFGNTSAGTKTTSGTLDRLRITTVGGTDTFDAGSVNILYEG
jgi:hypothetical protein